MVVRYSNELPAIQRPNRQAYQQDFTVSYPKAQAVVLGKLEDNDLIAGRYSDCPEKDLGTLAWFYVNVSSTDRIHSWHGFPAVNCFVGYC